MVDGDAEASVEGAEVAVEMNVDEGVAEDCCDEDDEGVSAGELDEDGIEDEKEEVRGEAATALATFFAGGRREVVVGATERTDEAEDDDEKGETVADSGVGELAFVWDADDWPGSSPV